MGTITYRSKIYEDYRPNFIVVDPPTIDDWEGEKFDVYHEAAKLARRDWRDEFGASAVVIDTATSLGNDLLQYVARAGLGRVKDPMILAAGDPVNRIVAPEMQDYGKAQDLLEALLRIWGTQPVHVFVLAHRGEVMKIVKVTERGQLKEFEHYGFKGPGEKMTKYAGGLFSQYTYLENIAGPSQPPSIRWRLTDTKDYRAKTRQLHAEAKPYIDLKWNQADPVGNLAMLRNAHNQVARWHGIRWDAPRQTGLAGRTFWQCCYAQSGHGKTTLFTAFPEELFAAGPVIYLAYDPASVYMETTFPELLQAGKPTAQAGS